MEAFDVPVRLRPPHLRPAVLDLLELEEQLVGVPVLGAAELAPVVAEDRLDLHPVFLEEGEYVVVQDLDRGHRHLRGVEPGPDAAAEAVQHPPDVDLAHPLQRPREEGVHGHELTRLWLGAVVCRNVTPRVAGKILGETDVMLPCSELGSNRVNG